jgi:hypothetical protein
MLQGDSRRLGEILREQVGACVASPPFQGGVAVKQGWDTLKTRPNGDKFNPGQSLQHDYGTSPGQLGALPPGSLSAAISSPPYADRCTNDNQRTLARDGLHQGHNEGDGATYGTAPAQLGNLPAGTVEAVVDGVVASPPYEASQQEDGRRRDPAHKGLVNHRMAERANPRTPGEKLCLMDYAAQNAEGNLASEAGTTFWEASKQILEQVVALLKPGGVAVFVVKAYVRDSQIVDFPGQWRTLCESLGLVTLHEHHALLVEDHGTQGGLFGEDTTHRTHKKSFFRRLHEKRRPDLAINHETVYCMQKPLDTAPGSVDVCCSSPPYATGDSAGPESLARRTDASAQAMLKSQGWNKGGQVTAGNLATMPPGSLDLCLSSPPYAGAGEVLSPHNGIDYSKAASPTGKDLTPGRAMHHYGHTEGQLGSMPAGTLSCVVSSPPYASSTTVDGRTITDAKTHTRPIGTMDSLQHGYGTTPGNLGHLPEGDTP